MLIVRCVGKGVSLETLILANSLGCRLTLPRLPQGAGVLMLPVERAGLLQRVDSQADALAVSGITGPSITIPLGDHDSTRSGRAASLFG